jgi:hypothetical protein
MLSLNSRSLTDQRRIWFAVVLGILRQGRRLHGSTRHKAIPRIDAVDRSGLERW